METPDEKALRLMSFSKAQEMWKSFNASERRGVEVGMFPAGSMKAAIAEGYDCRILSIEIMKIAAAEDTP